MWATLYNIKSIDYYGRWIFLGDFNVSLYEHEKRVNSSQLDSRLDFIDFINQEGLMDLDLLGIDFTWSNKRVGNGYIQACLDRVLISLDWTKDFVCNLNAIQKIASDHFSLIFKAGPTQARNNFPFKFEKMWM